MSAIELILLAGVFGVLLHLLRISARHDRRRSELVRATKSKQLEARARTQEALERPGALPTDPIVVTSAAAIEPRAQAEPCPLCAGRCHVDQDRIEDIGGRRIRHLDMRCGDCGRHSSLFFEVQSPQLN